MTGRGWGKKVSSACEVWCTLPAQRWLDKFVQKDLHSVPASKTMAVSMRKRVGVGTLKYSGAGSENISKTVETLCWTTKKGYFDMHAACSETL